MRRTAAVFSVSVAVAVMDLLIAPSGVAAFSGPSHRSSYRSVQSLHLTSTNSEGQEKLTISLEKPLGLILEEIDETENRGVVVAEVNEDGSAFSCEEKDDLIGMVLTSVMGTSVTNLGFDDVMSSIIDAPSPVVLEFANITDVEASAGSDAFSLGTLVPLTVVEGDKETSIQVKVGDNLRSSLLDSGFEVYRGFKSKIGNCGGAGQCTFCAVDFVSSEGWAERSEYEDSKLKKRADARLSCLNNIQGPAKIRLS